MQKMSSGFPSDILLFNLPAARYFAELSPTTIHHSEITLAGPPACSLSVFFHRHPLFSLCTSVMMLVVAVGSRYNAQLLGSGSGVHTSTAPPLVGEPSLLC